MRSSVTRSSRPGPESSCGSAFWNAGDEPLRFLEIISPGTFAGYFRDLAPLLAAGDEAGMQEVVARYELEIDFSTIPTLAERHGLSVAPPA